LLPAGEVARTAGIRQRVLTVVVLAALTSALSLLALYRVLSITTAQRVDRAREVESEELTRMLTGGEDPGTALVGMRGGDLGRTPPPAEWRGALERARAAGAILEEPLGASTLIVGTRSQDGRIVWAGYLVQPPSWLRTWQMVVGALALATALLTFAAIFAVISLKRSALTLQRALVALGDDLSSPIPPVPIDELSQVADGIKRLAERLATSRAAEEQLSSELAEKERLAALGRVAAGVAHEVRNPLASIKLRLDLAAAGAALPPDVDSALTNASSEIARLDRLVADLLVVAVRPLGPRAPRSIGELAEARAQVLLPWAQLRGVALTVLGDARASVDSESVGRAFDNLFRNAVEASPIGARVTARITTEAAQVRVAVEDTGPGVAAERACELFEPFFTTKPEGTGLGLALSRAIARAHGGDLVYARVGATTRFELRVPEGAPRT
jgi:signal transduction histidine kinase